MIAPAALRLCAGNSLQYPFDLQFLCCPCFLLQGFDLSRTVLVDNDDYKAADGEHENMLHVPHWEQTPGEEVGLRVKGIGARVRLENRTPNLACGTCHTGSKHLVRMTGLMRPAVVVGRRLALALWRGTESITLEPNRRPMADCIEHSYVPQRVSLTHLLVACVAVLCSCLQ